MAKSLKPAVSSFGGQYALCIEKHMLSFAPSSDCRAKRFELCVGYGEYDGIIGIALGGVGQFNTVGVFCPLWVCPRIEDIYLHT